MEKTFKIVDPVQWHEGMLLYPQHYQQMRLEYQQLSLCYLSMSTPFYWGVRYMQLDEAAFTSGIIRIQELLAVMPDGSIVKKEINEQKKIELDINEFKDQLQEKPMMIHLAVVKRHEDAANSEGDFPRYDSVEGKTIPDENTGEAPIPIPRLSLKVSLFVGDDISSRYSSFPLMRVRYKDDAFVREDFIPPFTTIRRDGPIGKLLSNVVKALRKRVSHLSERLQAPVTQDTAPIMDQYKKTYDIIVSRLLGLEALLFAETSHPFMAYRELSIAAGVFCSLSKGHMPPIFDPYNHNDLRATFTPVISFVNRMLDLVQSASVSIPFTLSDRIFEKKIQSEWMHAGYLVLGLKISSDISPKMASDWMREAVIASESVAESAREKRILGAPREIVEQVSEMGLTMSQGRLLIKVKMDSEYVKTGEKLQIFNLSDSQNTRPAEIVLYTAG